MAFNDVANKIKKLCSFRHGLRQTMVTLAAFGLCLIFSMFVVDRVEKARFIEAAKHELREGAINQEAFNAIKGIINEPSMLDGAGHIAGVICGLFLVWIIIRRAAGLTLSRPVTLPSAVEFSSAMRKMGLFDFSDQITCVHKHRLSVYIAKKPLLEEQGENICAKLYTYVHNDILVSEDLLTKNIGKRLLCLDADEYDSIYQQYSQTAQAVTLAKIAELKRTIDTLTGALSLKDDENTKLVEKNTALHKEKRILEDDLKMVKPRDDKDETANLRNLPLWRVLISLGARLKAEAKPGTEYISSQICKEFFTELEAHPESKEDIQKLLWPKQQRTDEADDKSIAATGTDKELPGWVMKIIKKDLGALARTKPGRPPNVK